MSKLPDCPEDLTEQQYANLVFGVHCSVSGDNVDNVQQRSAHDTLVHLTELCATYTVRLSNLLGIKEEMVRGLSAGNVRSQVLLWTPDSKLTSKMPEWMV